MIRIALIKTIFTTTCASLLLIGCGGDSAFDGSDNDDGDDSSTTVTAFDGTWSEGCLYDYDFLESDLSTVVINGTSGSVTIETYSTPDCTESPVRTETVPYTFTYQGDEALSDCYNGQKVDVTPAFPITINGNSYTEEEHDALPSDQQSYLALETEYDLFCTNEAATIFYTGDAETGDGTSDSTRPTSADLEEPLTKQ